ncbi:MAG: RhsD protein [Micavibrio aeruginosavorus]|uniref:RhsD protein n=1 Tax=Micavibrio aeruginosavorus TaxID=349221 RepID=A0A2W5MZJ8_9BACT|nr:MAG: RhsD protein [Micavibrio aeruginosavorus]
MFKTRKGLLAIVLILFLTGGLHLPDWDIFQEDKNSSANAITISDNGIEHILHGDETGGGHKFGTGKPCKSEFPKEWNNKEIIKTVEKIAANDNLKWRKQKNGYYTAEETVEGVRIRVVLNRKRDDVVTAYPVNTKRNPCNAANDNFNA